jgi:phosphohistidine phosphatase
MKTLYLVRHGSAEEKIEGSPDASRSLTDSGIMEIKDIAKKMKNSAEYPDLIISSPAIRAFETARIIANKLKYPQEKIEIQTLLYEADKVSAPAAFIKQLNPGLNSVCLVGHNPLLTDLARNLCTSFSGDIPKGGILSLEIPGDIWSAIDRATTKVKFFDFMGSQNDIHGQLRESLKMEIYEDLSVFFSKKHEETMKHMRPVLMKSAKRMASRYLDIVEKKTRKIRKSRS